MNEDINVEIRQLSKTNYVLTFSEISKIGCNDREIRSLDDKIQYMMDYYKMLTGPYLYTFTYSFDKDDFKSHFRPGFSGVILANGIIDQAYDSEQGGDSDKNEDFVRNQFIRSYDNTELKYALSEKRSGNNELRILEPEIFAFYITKIHNKTEIAPKTLEEMKKYQGSFDPSMIEDFMNNQDKLKHDFPFKEYIDQCKKIKKDFYFIRDNKIEKIFDYKKDCEVKELVKFNNLIELL